MEIAFNVIEIAFNTALVLYLLMNKDIDLAMKILVAAICLNRTVFDCVGLNDILKEMNKMYKMKKAMRKASSLNNEHLSNQGFIDKVNNKKVVVYLNDGTNEEGIITVNLIQKTFTINGKEFNLKDVNRIVIK